MVAKHKFQNASLSVHTSLPPERLVELAREAGDAVRNSVPGAAAVHVRDVYPMSASFAVATLGGRSEVMKFVFNVNEDVGAGGSSGTRGKSEILSFRTTQPKMYMIPVGPKSLVGYPQYKRFTQNLVAAVKSADPAATTSYVERTA